MTVQICANCGHKKGDHTADAERQGCHIYFDNGKRCPCPFFTTMATGSTFAIRADVERVAKGEKQCGAHTGHFSNCENNAIELTALGYAIGTVCEDGHVQLDGRGFKEAFGKFPGEETR